MFEDLLKCSAKRIKVIIHGGDCNLNREIIMDLQRFSPNSDFQGYKPAGKKNCEGERTQQGLSKKRGTQGDENWQTNEVAGVETAQKAKKMCSEICSFSA